MKRVPSHMILLVKLNSYTHSINMEKEVLLFPSISFFVSLFHVRFWLLLLLRWEALWRFIIFTVGYPRNPYCSRLYFSHLFIYSLKNILISEKISEEIKMPAIWVISRIQRPLISFMISLIASILSFPQTWKKKRRSI